MEFRGTGRLNKSQSGLFSSHYNITVLAEKICFPCKLFKKRERMKPLSQTVDKAIGSV